MEKQLTIDSELLCLIAYTVHNYHSNDFPDSDTPIWYWIGKMMTIPEQYTGRNDYETYVRLLSYEARDFLFNACK